MKMQRSMGASPIDLCIFHRNANSRWLLQPLGCGICIWSFPLQSLPRLSDGPRDLFRVRWFSDPSYRTVYGDGTFDTVSTCLKYNFFEVSVKQKVTGKKSEISILTHVSFAKAMIFPIFRILSYFWRSGEKCQPFRQQ